MKRGLVFNNQIVDVKSTDFEVSPEMRWIDVSDDCEPGWIVENDVAISPPVKTAEDLLNDLRVSRDSKLRKTDWTQLADIPEETKTAWQAYRQQLRDITNNYNSTIDVVWPTPPQQTLFLL